MAARTSNTKSRYGSGISGIRSDKRAELAQVLSVHAGLIIKSAARVVGSLEEAEDIAQDIAERILKSPPNQVQSWPALLKTMAVNAALDRLRRQKDCIDLDLEHLQSNPESILYKEQCANVLRTAISKLSARDAQLFAFFYFGDLTQVDIAEQLGMTANAVGVSLHRIRTQLASDVQALLNLQNGDTKT